MIYRESRERSTWHGWRDNWSRIVDVVKDSCLLVIFRVGVVLARMVLC